MKILNIFCQFLSAGSLVQIRCNEASEKWKRSTKIVNCEAYPSVTRDARSSLNYKAVIINNCRTGQISCYDLMSGLWKSHVCNPHSALSFLLERASAYFQKETLLQSFNSIFITIKI